MIEDSGAAEGAAKSDMEKRVLARRDKKSKLKNPIFFVSPVRLSVRNLARHVTDAKLKAMAVAAARSGIESGRSNPQDVRRYLEAQVGGGRTHSEIDTPIRRLAWCSCGGRKTRINHLEIVEESTIIQPASNSKQNDSDQYWHRPGAEDRRLTFSSYTLSVYHPATLSTAR